MDVRRRCDYIISVRYGAVKLSGAVIVNKDGGQKPKSREFKKIGMIFQLLETHILIFYINAFIYTYADTRFIVSS